MYFFFVPLSLSLSALTKPHIILYRAKHHHASKERESKERASIEVNSSRVHPTKRERGVREEALCVFESCVELENFQKRREREKQRHNNTFESR